WRKRSGNAYSRPAIHGRPARPHRVPIAPIASPAWHCKPIDEPNDEALIGHCRVSTDSGRWLCFRRPGPAAGCRDIEPGHVQEFARPRFDKVRTGSLILPLRIQRLQNAGIADLETPAGQME